jgi:hypothetical protein
MPLSSPAAASIGYPWHLDDHFTFHWCVREGTHLDLRPHPDNAGVGVESDDLAAVFGRTHPLHRMFEQFEPGLRSSDDGHNAY